MNQLSLAAVDEACPPANPAYSQWFTDPKLAARIVTWARVRPGMRVLEPSCGVGRFIIPAARAGAEVTGIDIDERLVSSTRIELDRLVLNGENLDVRLSTADFLKVPVDEGLFDLGIGNPPYEDGQDTEHVCRTMLWAPRYVGLLPLAFECTLRRYESVWKHLRMTRKINFITRPSFGGAYKGSTDFAVFELVRRLRPREDGDVDRVEVEWWDP